MLSVYTLEQAKEWDGLVRSFKNYDIYWLSGYVRAFWIHGDGLPLLFYYTDGDTRGINVVIKRDVADDSLFTGKIPRGEFFDLSTPYGYGGWIIEGKEIVNLFDAYEKKMIEDGIISEFVRFHPMIENHTIVNKMYDVKELGYVVHMELESPEVIWENITSKNRNMIRKAIKNDVKIYNGRFPEIFDKFMEIYNSTMDRDKADDYYYFGKDFYLSIMNDLPQNAQVFYAEKDGVVIAASIMLMANGKMNYHLSGSRIEFATLAPTNLLLYEAALWGCMNGYKTLYLGGGVGSQADNLFKFKRSFYKGNLRRYYIGCRIYNKDKYEELVAMRGELEKGYFPLYRARPVNV